MQEFPKALYHGDLVIHEPAIAQNAEQEANLRSKGYVDFVNLPEPQPEETGTPIELSGISEEDYNKVVQERDAALAILNSVSAMKERIAEMQGDTTPVGTVKYAVDYNSMTADQLRALLDERGIKYLVRDSKDTLIALLEQPESVEA